MGAEHSRDLLSLNLDIPSSLRAVEPLLGEARRILHFKKALKGHKRIVVLLIDLAFKVNHLKLSHSHPIDIHSNNRECDH